MRQPLSAMPFFSQRDESKTVPSTASMRHLAQSARARIKMRRRRCDDNLMTLLWPAEASTAAGSIGDDDRATH
jgi:hypothetical protein